MSVFEDDDELDPANDPPPPEDDPDDTASRCPFLEEPEREHPFLERDMDRNGREIWVESRDYHGRPYIWYLAQTNGGVPNGKFSRYERIPGLGIFGKTLEALPTEPTVRPPPG